MSGNVIDLAMRRLFSPPPRPSAGPPAPQCPVIPLPVVRSGIEVREETGWTCVLLAPGIAADEVRRALRGSGLTVVPGEGCATIQRETTPLGAA